MVKESGYDRLIQLKYSSSSGRISKVKWFNINKSVNRMFKTKPKKSNYLNIVCMIQS